MTLTPEQEASIEAQTNRYRKRLLEATDRPPRPKIDKAERLRAQLERVQVRLMASDLRRSRMLLTEARLHLDAGDHGKVYACALELAQMCRLAMLGLEGAHPVLPSFPPPPSLPAPETVQ